MTTLKCTSAEATLGADLIGLDRYSWLRTRTVPRKIRRIGVAGSTAIGDTAVKLYYGDQLIGEFFNTTLGNTALPKADDMINLDPNRYIDANEPLSIIVSDAAADTFGITLEIQDYSPPSSTRYKAKV